MSQVQQVYQWQEEIREHLPLSKWQAMGLALLSLGIVWSEHSWVSKVAEHLGKFGLADSMERRLQRWLSNPRIGTRGCAQAWSAWVLSSLVERSQVILLVDLTSLSNRMDVMMIGLAYRERCIPLVWRCMVGHQTWPKGQVELIGEMLRGLMMCLPADCRVILQADRGIGNSSDLVKAVSALGCHYLFRVSDTVRVHFGDPAVVLSLGDLIARRRAWSGVGYVFKNGGWIHTHIYLYWRKTMDDPWCLITNAPTITGALYAVRMWQEEGFRDLKSGGWQWQRSLIRNPQYAERLLLALALAYGWTLAMGTRAIRAGKPILRRLTRGRKRTYSVFRLGLRHIRDCLANDCPLSMSLFFYPSHFYF